MTHKTKRVIRVNFDAKTRKQWAQDQETFERLGKKHGKLLAESVMETVRTVDAKHRKAAGKRISSPAARGRKKVGSANLERVKQAAMAIPKSQWPRDRKVMADRIGLPNALKHLRALKIPY